MVKCGIGGNITKNYCIVEHTASHHANVLKYMSITVTNAISVTRVYSVDNKITKKHNSIECNNNDLHSAYLWYNQGETYTMSYSVWKANTEAAIKTRYW